MAQYLDLEGAKVIINKIKEGDNRTYIQRCNSGDGKYGYINIAQITITNQYQNQPIEIKLIQRTKFGTIIILFNNTENNDPGLTYLKKIGDIEAYIVRKSTGLWELYVKKNEMYDSIDIVELYKGGYMDYVNIKWTDVFVESLPSGYNEAKLMEMDTAGNSATATKLATARTIALSGSVTGSGSFDGSGNLSIATTTNHTHTKSQITDMPTSLKNPTALTVQFNGATNKTYDGSSAQTVDITPGGIGAYTKGEVDNKISPLNNNINQLSNPNLYINSGFQVWQRGTEFKTNIKDSPYTTDRWRVGSDIEGSVLLTKGNYSVKIKALKVCEYINFLQIVEDETFKFIQDKKVTVTFKLRNLTDKIVQIWGAGTDSNKKMIYHGKKFFTGVTSDTFSATFDLNTNLIRNEFGIQFKPTEVNQEIEIVWAKLEIGERATPFIPTLYEEELSLCQRYYQTHVASGVANTTKVLGISSRYPTTMRVKPTLTFKDDIIHEHGKGEIGKNTLFDDYSALEDRIDYMGIKTKDIFTVGKIYNVQGICLDAEIY